MGKKNQQIQQYLDKLPHRIEPPIEMESPNQQIDVFKGEYQLKVNGREVLVDGSIFFKWYPSKGVIFTGEISKGSVISDPDETGDHVEVYVNGLLFGKGTIANKWLSSTETVSGRCYTAYLGETNIKVSKVIFSIPNFNYPFGDRIKCLQPDGSQKSYDGRLTFDNGKYKIIIDRSENFKLLGDALNDSGGYLLLCGGVITKQKGNMSLGDIEGLLFCFNNFLYFLNGKRTSLYFLKGIHEGEIIWSDFTNYSCDDYNYVSSWSNIRKIQDLNSLWSNFSIFWKNDNDRDFLNSVIHWYVEANANPGYVEGAIILAQTALELIYNWLLVEQKKIIIGQDANDISASNKIRLILSQLKVDSGIPASFTNLASIPNATDGPETFTLIRNCLVHGQEQKRKKLQTISVLAKYEALQLGIWYLELSILFILQYRGKYKNRTSENKWFGDGEIVPWSL